MPEKILKKIKQKKFENKNFEQKIEQKTALHLDANWSSPRLVISRTGHLPTNFEITTTRLHLSQVDFLCCVV